MKLFEKIFLVVWFLVAATIVTCCGPQGPNRYRSRIVSIGGCDSQGMCGVKLADSTILTDVRQPVVGSYPNCAPEGSCREVLQ